MSSISLSFSFQPKRVRNGKPKASAPPAGLPKGNIPRVSKLLALAHHFEELRQQDVVTDYADLARLGGVTRARMTQIMSLLNLAPDIQEEILYLPQTIRGFDPVSTKKVLPIAQEMNWQRQRAIWNKMIILYHTTR